MDDGGSPNVDDNGDGIIDNALEFGMGTHDDYRGFSGIQESTRGFTGLD